MSALYPIKNAPGPTPQDDPIIPIAQRKTMTTLLPDDCRWPIGDPQAANSTCSAPVRPGRVRVVTYRPRDAV
jgi:hypothetical protein